MLALGDWRGQSVRCLVVGANGWVGTAVKKSLSFRQVPLLSTRSSQTLSNLAVRCQVEEFNPDTLIFLAGVTPDRERHLGPARFESALEAVSAELAASLALPSLRRACYLSSGIVEQPEQFPESWAKSAYREAKVREESLFDRNGEHLDTLIVRLYSLSGPYARRPQVYAFHDLLGQGPRGLIKVESTQPVLRSYVSVTDLAEALVASLSKGQTGVRVTGGEPIELGELAQRISEVVFPDAEVLVPERQGATLSYCGDDDAWQAWCATVGIEPMDLNQQIIQTAEWLSGTASAWS